MSVVRIHLIAIGLALAVTGTLDAHTNERGLDARNFDTNANPCQDFWQYANGGWLKANPIPAQYSQWSLDDELRERNLAVLREMLETAANTASPKGSNLQKIGDFYAAAIDQAAANRLGYAPIQGDLASIAALGSMDGAVALIQDWQTRGFDVLFHFSTEADLKNSNTAIAYAGQGGLSLPDRDYYLRNDADSKKLRAKYLTHVERLLTLIGEKNAHEQAHWVLDLETRLAKASLDRVALRDPASSYHIYTIGEADAKTPHFSWSAFFQKIGRADVSRFSLSQPDFFSAVDQAFTHAPLAHWQAYLRWNLINFAAPYLSQVFVDEDFAFNDKTLRGDQQLKPLWKRAIDSTNAALGEAVGEMYVQRLFPPEAKTHAMTLVNNLKAALRARLEKLDWMSQETKTAAFAKLDTLTVKIGYPDHWRDYTKLTINRESHLANMRAAMEFEAQRQFAKMDHPVDKSEWDMTPQTVNAYYNPMQNEIVFPAAQLMPPYFDANADDAVNYGGIGTVIGHEMLHGFDDEGSQFDAQGNLRDWWSKSDREQFETRTTKLVQQFDAYVPIGKLHINGKLTLGENIADFGGLLVAYDAYKLAVKEASELKIDALTGDQRFFLSYAQTWRTSERDERLKLQVQSNEHAPAKFRVIGPISDTPAFAAAFGCTPGSAMLRDESKRVSIW